MRYVGVCMHARLLSLGLLRSACGASPADDEAATEQVEQLAIDAVVATATTKIALSKKGRARFRLFVL